MAENKQEKTFEIVHRSRGRRERTVKCEAIDCKNRVKKGEELCASCRIAEDKNRREYALW